MRVQLLHPDRNADVESVLLPNHAELTTDLGLDTLFSAMAAGDRFLFDVSRHALLTSLSNDAVSIAWRQDVLRDCLGSEAVIRKLYALSIEAEERRRKAYYSFGPDHPDAMLSSSVRLLESLLEVLRELRVTTVAASPNFASAGLKRFSAMLAEELQNGYLTAVARELGNLSMWEGALISGALGPEGKVVQRTLRETTTRDRTPLLRLLTPGPRSYALYIHRRDDAGWRALGELRDSGISLVADAVGRSAAHVVAFFRQLRHEIGFYVGCLNLGQALKGRQICFPAVLAQSGFRCADLRETCLELSVGTPATGNDVEGVDRKLIFVTGANRGGKSTFLRSLGLAQLMTQTGMFVTAEAFATSLTDGLFTQFAREEDSSMTSGKFDAELARMSTVIDQLGARPLILFNESFAGTNEREGTAVARQIVESLLDRGVRIVFVTHMYELARGLGNAAQQAPLYLRAEQGTDGKRSFRLIEAEPLPTGHAEDLYATLLADVLAQIPRHAENSSEEPASASWTTNAHHEDGDAAARRVGIGETRHTDDADAN